MNLLIRLMKKIISKYEMKHAEYCEPIFICNHIETRHRANGGLRWRMMIEIYDWYDNRIKKRRKA